METVSASNKSKCTIKVPNSQKTQYLYIRPIDYADNIGKTVKIIRPSALLIESLKKSINL